jgi:hypothetical protein
MRLGAQTPSRVRIPEPPPLTATRPPRLVRQIPAQADTGQVLVRPDVRPGLVVGVGALYAGLASLTRPLTGGAAVAVAVPAAIVVVRAWRPRPQVVVPAAGPLRRTAAAWGAVLVLVAAVELVAFARQPAYDVAYPDLPTLSVLLDPLTSAGATRFLAWSGWLWVGWRLARR